MGQDAAKAPTTEDPVYGPQWREQRKVSKQLTLNYKRVMYLLEPTEAAKETQGKRVQVYEDDAGIIEMNVQPTHFRSIYYRRL